MSTCKAHLGQIEFNVLILNAKLMNILIVTEEITGDNENKLVQKLKKKNLLKIEYILKWS